MTATPLTGAQQSASDVLVAAGTLRVVDADPAKAGRFLAQSADALAQLPTMTSAAVAFNTAYDAAHDVGEAVLAAYGYRTAGLGAHIAVGEFLRIVFDSPPPSTAATRYDSLRQIRNNLRYRAVPAGSAQAADAAHTATALLEAAREIGI